MVGEIFVLGSGSCYVPTDPMDLGADGLSVHDPTSVILVIFLHGSETENQQDICVPRGTWSSTPAVISALCGAAIDGRHLLVFAHCTNVSPSTTGQITPADTKVSRRFIELGKLIGAFLTMGFKKEQIVVAGHSTGAWVALLFLALNPGAYCGAIAFAPAFSGKSATRSADWENLRSSSVASIAQAQKLPALIYAFEHDEFENPDALCFLKQLPETEFIPFKGRKSRILATSPLLFHCGAYHQNFLSERTRIIDFIQRHSP